MLDTSSASRPLTVFQEAQARLWTITMQGWQRWVWVVYGGEEIVSDHNSILRQGCFDSSLLNRCGWTSGKTSTFRSILEQEKQRKEICLSNFPSFREQPKCMLWPKVWAQSSSSSWNQAEEVEKGPEVQIFSVVLGNDISRESGVTHTL